MAHKGKFEYKVRVSTQLGNVRNPAQTPWVRSIINQASEAASDTSTTDAADGGPPVRDARSDSRRHQALA
jgi:hypothetical protein